MRKSPGCLDAPRAGDPRLLRYRPRDSNRQIEPGRFEAAELLEAKLAVAGNDPVDVSDKKLNSLMKQVQGQLRPVLREVRLCCI